MDRRNATTGTLELTMRVGLALIACASVLRLVLPASVHVPSGFAWGIAGLLAGFNRKPPVRQRLIALLMVAGLWALGFTALFAAQDPRAADLSVARIGALLGVQIAGGLMGGVWAFGGMLLTSGWPSRPSRVADPAEGEVLVRVERGAADEDSDDDLVGRVEAVGPGVAPDWLGRRVLMLSDAQAQLVIVPLDGLVALGDPVE